MKKKPNKKYVVHGSVERYLKKTIHGIKKANEQENKEGSFDNLTRRLRAKAQNEYPDATSAEIERIIDRQIKRGMKAYKTSPKPKNPAPPEENLVSERELARQDRQRKRKAMQGSRRKR